MSGSVHGSLARETRYEEYHEFFSLLASGDRTQFARAQKLVPSLQTPPSTPSDYHITQLVRADVDTLSDFGDESDDGSSTSTLVDVRDLLGEGKAGTEVAEAVGEVTTLNATLNATPEISSPPLPDKPSLLSPSATQPPFRQPSATGTRPSSPQEPLQSSAFATDASIAESRVKLAQLLRGLCDVETFRSLVREVLLDSESSYRPLKELEALRAQATAAIDSDSSSENIRVRQDPILEGFGDDKDKHPTKKRCVMRPNKGGDTRHGEGKVGFRGAQLLMDMVSSVMPAPGPYYKSGQNPYWNKIKTSLGNNSMPWVRPRAAKKRTFTDLDE